MRSSFFRLSALFVLGGALTSVFVASVRADATSVHGRVMGQTEDGEHLGPVPGAKVEFLNSRGASAASAVADEAGYYRIAEMAAPVYAYRITASGYRTEDAQREVEVSAEGAHVLDFVLTKGDDPPDARPGAKPDDPSSTPPRKKPGANPRRNPNGGAGNRPTDPDDAGGGNLAVLTWKEQAGRRSPYPNVDLCLRLVEGGQVLNRSSGPQGRTVFPLPPGEWRVSASVPGVAAVVYPQPVRIVAGSRTDIEFTIPLPPPKRRAPLPTPPTNDGGKACFYGDVAAARRIVFVVDKSNSMQIDKFDEAAAELMRSVNYLTEQQQFYVLFFSNRMYPMFGSEAPAELVPASADHRERLQKYLGDLPFHLGTNAHASMERAFALKPDVIYLLGDGAFTDDTADYLLGLKDNTVPICTVAFKSKERGARIMKQIAEAHHGRFMYVP